MLKLKSLLIQTAAVWVLAAPIAGCSRGEASLESLRSAQWNIRLHTMLQGVTRVRIRTGGTCHRNPQREKTLHSETRPQKIQKLVRMLVVDPRRSGSSCMCCGSLSLEFYRGKHLIVTLSLHHAKRLRWRQGWPGDGTLEPAKAKALVAWLASHGSKGPANEVQQERDRDRRAERKVARATQGLGPTVKKAYREGAKAFSEALSTAFPDVQRRIVILFRVLGASNGSWSELDWQDQRADKLLRKYPELELQKACKTTLTGKDRQTRRGAARFWNSWRSPLSSWQPQHPAPLHKIVLEIMQQSRYYPLRIQALKHLAGQRSVLPRALVASCLNRALQDPHVAVRRQAMLAVAEMGHISAIGYLLKILQGGLATTKPLPAVPASELVDIPEGFDQVANKATPSEVAALALGYLSYKAAKPIIEKRTRKSPSAMYRVALALLGQPQLLQARDFNTKGTNQALQLAAVEAVLRARGRHGLEHAFRYRLATHWWETKLVVTKLKTMLLKNNAPGQSQIRAAKRPIDLERWYKQHGGAYLHQLERNSGSH